jgi:hypothetical protein
VLYFSGLTISLAMVWRYIFWGFVFVAGVNTAASAVNLFRPYWTPVRASLRLVSDLIGGVLFCWVMKANIVAGLSITNVPPEKAAHIANAINWWSAKMFPFAIVACVLILVTNAYRIFRVRPSVASGIALNAATGVR